MAGRPQNLKPWRPGQSGNPGGRPRRRTVAVAVDEILQSAEFEEHKLEPGEKVVDLVARVIVRGALAGRFAFVDLILNRDRLNFDEDDLRRMQAERPRIKIPNRDDRYPGDRAPKRGEKPAPVSPERPSTPRGWGGHDIKP